MDECKTIHMKRETHEGRETEAETIEEKNASIKWHNIYAGELVSGPRVNKGMPHVFTHRYGLQLDSENSWQGTMSCRITGTYVGRSSQTSPLWRSCSSIGYFRFNFQTLDVLTGDAHACYNPVWFLAPKQDIRTWASSWTLTMEGDLKQTNYDWILRCLSSYLRRMNGKHTGYIL